MIFGVDVLFNTALLIKLRSINRRKALFKDNYIGFQKFEILENSIRNIFKKNFHFFTIYLGICFT